MKKENKMKNIVTYVTKNKILKKLVLSKSVDKDILRMTGRLIEIKGEVYLALESFLSDGKAVQKNIPIADATEKIADLVPSSFKQLNIITTMGDCEVKVSKKDKITVIDKIKKDNVKETEISKNNKDKNYIIPDTEPVDFLIALGVQDKNGRIFDKKRSKFRQINRFLETVSDVEKEIVKGDDLYILDLCCGKSYLSFAVYYYFTKIKGYKVQMDCVDLKKDVIEYCGKVAKELKYSGLNFVAGDINEFKIKRAPDLTVSLHACDIATDIVLAKGIASGSRVIMSTPCCHHEMMWQLKPKGNALDILLKHSILKQKFADSLTDSLRCKALEINGYEVNALELIDPEETPKNVLIRAVKKDKISEKEVERLTKEYKEICDMFGITPYLLGKYVK